MKGKKADCLHIYSFEKAQTTTTFTFTCINCANTTTLDAEQAEIFKQNNFIVISENVGGAHSVEC